MPQRGLQRSVGGANCQLQQLAPAACCDLGVGASCAGGRCVRAVSLLLAVSVPACTVVLQLVPAGQCAAALLRIILGIMLMLAVIRRVGVALAGGTRLLLKRRAEQAADSRGEIG